MNGWLIKENHAISYDWLTPLQGEFVEDFFFITFLNLYFELLEHENVRPDIIFSVDLGPNPPTKIMKNEWITLHVSQSSPGLKVRKNCCLSWYKAGWFRLYLL